MVADAGGREEDEPADTLQVYPAFTLVLPKVQKFGNRKKGQLGLSVSSKPSDITCIIYVAELKALFSGRCVRAWQCVHV